MHIQNRIRDSGGIYNENTSHCQTCKGCRNGNRTCLNLRKPQHEHDNKNNKECASPIIHFHESFELRCLPRNARYGGDNCNGSKDSRKNKNPSPSEIVSNHSANHRPQRKPSIYSTHRHSESLAPHGRRISANKNRHVTGQHHGPADALNYSGCQEHGKPEGRNGDNASADKNASPCNKHRFAACDIRKPAEGNA